MPDHPDAADPTGRRPLVALISATPASIPPATRAFAAEYPSAELLNLLDDGLLEQANRAGGLNAHLTDRMRRLIEHAVLEGADGILLTCSMYSSVAGLARPELGVPILGPDDAAFGAATDGTHHHVLVVASLPAALADAQARLADLARRVDRPLELQGTVAAGAFEAVQEGDGTALLTALTAAVQPFSGAVDAVLLAQYSLAPAAAELERSTGLPVLSGPVLAAQAIRDAIAAEAVVA